MNVSSAFNHINHPLPSIPSLVLYSRSQNHYLTKYTHFLLLQRLTKPPRHFVWWRLIRVWAEISQSVQRIGTGWRSGNRIPVGGEIFHTRPDKHWGPPSLLYNGSRFWAKSLRRMPLTTHPQSSAEVKERVDQNIYFSSGPSWHVLRLLSNTCQQ
jgi:hypothetical protein